MAWTQSTKRSIAVLLATVSAGVISAQSAQGAAFALREQSAYSQGASFAGASAQTNALSTFFFNPAIMTEFEGITTEGIISVLAPFTDADTTINPALPPLPILAGRGTTDNIGKEAIVPASYASYQFNDKIWVGLGVNAPFGLGTRSDPGSLEAFNSTEFSALTINFQPTVAYKFNDRFSIAIGAQAQYIDVEQSVTGISGTQTELNATGWSGGVILGATLKPTDKTTIGFGYRSQMDVNLEGDVVVSVASTGALVPGGSGFAQADLALPDIVNVGIKHEFTEKFSLLGQFSWENWSRLQEVDVFAPTVVPTLGAAGGLTAGDPLSVIDFNYEDSYFFAIGGEYGFNDHITVRAGVAYETSPTSETDRTLALPDNNRLWISTGGTYKMSEHIEADFGFTWIRVERDTQVNNNFQSGQSLAAIGAGPFAGSSIATGTADSDVFIFTAGSRIRF